MKSFGEKIAMVIAALIALYIIFVKSGQVSGVSGGQQTKTILDAFGANVNRTIGTLQGQGVFTGP